MFSLKSILAVAAFACLASAETIKVTATSDNKFNPDTIKANAGDVLEFHFQPKNHSVAAGDYRYPCTPLSFDDQSRFFSAFVPSDNGEASKVFRVTLNSTAPTVFYSTQGNECAKGMVGIINPNATVTLDDYKKRASTLSEGVSPRTTPFGGVLADNNGSGSSSSPSPAPSSGSNGKGGDKKNAAVSVHASAAGLFGVAVLAAILA
ncbi:Extracellular serine-rich protein [Cladobotryum mycophilum]|uniref:Extracellular serine-rich protein n=1 Tax=Cladobotryum mycophilum TaxID=491253 RepID=A0ABR0T2X4_9HYPO